MVVESRVHLEETQKETEMGMEEEVNHQVMTMPVENMMNMVNWKKRKQLKVWEMFPLLRKMVQSQASSIKSSQERQLCSINE